MNCGKKMKLAPLRLIREIERRSIDRPARKSWIVSYSWERERKRTKEVEGLVLARERRRWGEDDERDGISKFWVN
jgi:hypothetical protein